MRFLLNILLVFTVSLSLAKQLPEIATHELTPLPLLENKLLRTRLEKLDSEMLDFTNNFIETTINEAVMLQFNLVENLKEFFEYNLNY